MVVISSIGRLAERLYARRMVMRSIVLAGLLVTAVAPPPADAQGFPKRVPVLEYHLVREKEAGQFVVSRDQFRADLALLYERGYRPITVAQLVAGDLSDVPVGMSPVVFTFDDASPEQFSYVERDGRLEVDSNSVIGMWVEFQRTRPDWKSRATFCLLSGAAAGNSFFGDDLKHNGQKREWRFRKVRWLADNGFELCNHTLWHAKLDDYPDAAVQEQIARGQMAIDSAVPGYRVRTFSLPLGIWPKNRDLAWRGTWTDPPSGRQITYDHRTVLTVAGGPVRSPLDAYFDPARLTRFIVSGSNLKGLLDNLEATGARFRRQ
jgi:peptidoglycan/xylan/chitin deacetylase (PgdA/CDA1 family)